MRSAVSVKRQSVSRPSNAQSRRPSDCVSRPKSARPGSKKNVKSARNKRRSSPRSKKRSVCERSRSRSEGHARRRNADHPRLPVRLVEMVDVHPRVVARIAGNEEVVDLQALVATTDVVPMTVPVVGATDGNVVTAAHQHVEPAVTETEMVAAAAAATDGNVVEVVIVIVILAAAATDLQNDASTFPVLATALPHQAVTVVVIDGNEVQHLPNRIVTLAHAVAVAVVVDGDRAEVATIVTVRHEATVDHQQAIDPQVAGVTVPHEVVMTVVRHPHAAVTTEVPQRVAAAAAAAGVIDKRLAVKVTESHKAMMTGIPCVVER
eukprot:m.150081 g.150081  ORF g.150081 m.150081 type:complete len:321 (-) comp30707_c0_seq1:335-1297(-)